MNYDNSRNLDTNGNERTSLRTPTYIHNDRPLTREGKDDSTKGGVTRKVTHKEKNMNTSTALHSFKTLKSNLQCPNCENKLDIQISPKSSAKFHANLGFTKANINPPVPPDVPSVSGDSNEQQQLGKNKKSVWSEFNEQNTYKNMTEFLNAKHNANRNSRTHELSPSPCRQSRNRQSTVRPARIGNSSSTRSTYEKSNVSRPPGKIGEQANPNIRSGSFVVVPATAPSYNESADVPSVVVAPLTCITVPGSNTPMPYPFPYSQLTNDKPLPLESLEVELGVTARGLDTLEAATLYDSSASSSKESLTNSRCASPGLSSPRLENPASKFVGCSLLTGDADNEKRKPIPHEKTTDVGVDFDIPEHRMDLYKDSLTLFLERIFGKFS